MTGEYGKTQDLFKQNGNLLSEASKLIHYLDSTTFNSSNMVKTMREYYTMIKLNKQMLRIKLKQDNSYGNSNVKSLRQNQLQK